MWPALRENSATMDEPVFLGAGYSYWLGHRYYFNAEHPPLMQLWSALPLRWLPVRLPLHIEKYLEQPSPLTNAATWEANIVPREQPTGFYTYPHLEAGYFGQALLYRGVNNADQLLTWSRLMQVVVTLATGLAIFGWARSLSNTTGGFIALRHGFSIQWLSPTGTWSSQILAWHSCLRSRFGCLTGSRRNRTPRAPRWPG